MSGAACAKPACSRPWRNWPGDKTPLPEVSSASKSSRRCRVSSGLSWSAIACSATFFKVLELLNERKRSKRPSSPRMLIATDGVMSRNQGWAKAWSAVNLSAGLRLSSIRIKFFASAEASVHGAPAKETMPFRTLAKMSSSVLPGKAGRPHKRVYMMTPHDHKSHRLSYLLESTWGATYCGVPTTSLCNSAGRETQERPKSISFRTLFSTGPGLWKRKFSGLRSRCATLSSCM
mmetsp:Transcript_3917/g.10880  ORF Transcript_3917/g.10880 Transcript_3917/m.10880 type:complete len:233 (+) Transcript_3917:385-1083(+)